MFHVQRILRRGNDDGDDDYNHSNVDGDDDYNRSNDDGDDDYNRCNNTMLMAIIRHDMKLQDCLTARRSAKWDKRHDAKTLVLGGVSSFDNSNRLQ